MSGGITAGTGMAIMGGALLGGAILSSNAARGAAQTQADAAANATAQQQNALNQQIALNQPFYDVGVAANKGLSTQAPYTPAAFNYNQNTDPGTQFRLQQGLNAMNATAAARGGLISGNALKAGQDYGQAQGSQEYQNAFNRYLAGNAQNAQAYGINTANQQFLANQGQSSANNTANSLGNFGNAAASNAIGAGNAQAAGQVGSANAYSSAVGQGIGAYQTNSLMNMLGNRNATAYDYGGGTTGAAGNYAVTP
jgi:hypothetical protein